MLELRRRAHTRSLLERVTLEDAFSADEAFLTSTTRGVLPIVQLDDNVIGDGTVGPVTRELMAALGARASRRG